MNTLTMLAISFQPAKVWTPDTGFSLDGLGIWISAILSLFIFSFLYKDNPLYKFAESIFVGVSIGYLVGIVYHNGIEANVYQVMVSKLDPATLKNLHYFQEIKYLIQHYHSLDYWPLVALVMGLLTLSPFLTARHAWLTSIPFAFYMGWGSGVAIPANMQAAILAQLYGTTYAFSVVGASLLNGTFNLWNLLWTFVMLLGIVATLWYFYFSAEHKGWLGGGVARLGIWFVMVGFGAAFGFTVMARVSLLIGRIEFLLKDWLGLITY